MPSSATVINQVLTAGRRARGCAESDVGHIVLTRLFALLRLTEPGHTPR